MATAEYIRVLKRINEMIRMRSTGSPEDFACRLAVSERSLYNYISVLKELGAPIRYSRCNESYVYEEEGGFILEFEKLSDIEYVV